MRPLTEQKGAPHRTLEGLFDELASLEYSDQDYLRQANPTQVDTLAYAFRQERREEILAALGTSVARA